MFESVVRISSIHSVRRFPRYLISHGRGTSLFLGYPGPQMLGLRRLSTDIGGVVSHYLLAYASPLPAFSSSSSLLSVERRVQRKPEALFFLGRIHSAGIRLEFTSLPLGLGGAGLGITKIVGLAQAHIGQAALKV
jgi:hypothetical protein